MIKILILLFSINYNCMLRNQANNVVSNISNNREISNAAISNDNISQEIMEITDRFNKKSIFSSTTIAYLMKDPNFSILLSKHRNIYNETNVNINHDTSFSIKYPNATLYCTKSKLIAIKQFEVLLNQIIVENIRMPNNNNPIITIIRNVNNPEELFVIESLEGYLIPIYDYSLNFTFLLNNRFSFILKYKYLQNNEETEFEFTSNGSKIKMLNKTVTIKTSNSHFYSKTITEFMDPYSIDKLENMDDRFVDNPIIETKITTTYEDNNMNNFTSQVIQQDIYYDDLIIKQITTTYENTITENAQISTCLTIEEKIFPNKVEHPNMNYYNLLIPYIIITTRVENGIFKSKTVIEENLLRMDRVIVTTTYDNENTDIFKSRIEEETTYLYNFIDEEKFLTKITTTYENGSKVFKSKIREQNYYYYTEENSKRRYVSSLYQAIKTIFENGNEKRFISKTIKTNIYNFSQHLPDNITDIITITFENGNEESFLNRNNQPLKNGNDDEDSKPLRNENDEAFKLKYQDDDTFYYSNNIMEMIKIKPENEDEEKLTGDKTLNNEDKPLQLILNNGNYQPFKLQTVKKNKYIYYTNNLKQTYELKYESQIINLTFQDNNNEFTEKTVIDIDYQNDFFETITTTYKNGNKDQFTLQIIETNIFHVPIRIKKMSNLDQPTTTFHSLNSRKTSDETVSYKRKYRPRVFYHDLKYKKIIKKIKTIYENGVKTKFKLRTIEYNTFPVFNENLDEINLHEMLIEKPLTTTTSTFENDSEENFNEENFVLKIVEEYIYNNPKELISSTRKNLEIVLENLKYIKLLKKTKTVYANKEKKFKLRIVEENEFPNILQNTKLPYIFINKPLKTTRITYENGKSIPKKTEVIQNFRLIN